jgi:DNA processing protein
MTIDDIALTLHRGLGAISIARLVDHFGSASEVYAVGENALVEAGVKRDIARAITLRQTHQMAEQEFATLQKHAIGCTAVGDKEYPKMLFDIPDRPQVLYYMGCIECLNRHTLAVVGTRNASSYGMIMTDKLIEYLAKRTPDATIVSGLAFGTDSNAHRAALRYGMATAAVIPAVLPAIVPSEHSALAHDIIDKGGVIVSEFNSMCRPSRNSFVTRNRIIAGVSEGTLVVESKASGGSMSTAEYTVGYNRTLLALPGRANDITSAGTNRLIVNRMASAVCSGEDIVREMYWDASDAQIGILDFDGAEPTSTQQRVLNNMPTSDPVSIDTLCEKCGISKGELATLLIDMELDGIVRRHPGDCYVKV